MKPISKKIGYIIIAILLILQIITIVFITVDFKNVDSEQNQSQTTPENKESNITLEFFHAKDCGHCEEKEPVVDLIAEYYGDKINVSKLYIEVSENNKKFVRYGFISTPGLVIANQSNGNKSVFPYIEITEENLKKSIDYHLAGNYTEDLPEFEQNILETPFGAIDLAELSLPVLTIILGAIDSVNPCSFFVLLCLLSILLYTKSRKRMLLVGSIFIFFSGFIYFLLMSAILEIFLIIQQTLIIAIIAGIVALVFGGLNIKDFFFFKKGPTTSIPDDKKSKLIKQMSKIVKMKSVFPVILASIVLAISANTVELLCSFNLPLIYTKILSDYSLSPLTNFTYLFFYNLIYVIPLLIIVIAVVVTLGRWKLSEFQGRLLKLFSGLMIFSLGIVFLTSYSALENMFLIFVILGMSALMTFLISFIWKRFVEFQEK